MATPTSGGLEFAILGTLEVRRHGRAVPLVGLRQRALLAILLLHAGEVVSTDRLITDLFGEDASSGAANALQQSVSRLRRSLDDRAANGNPLVTRSPGYRLEVEDDQVDLHRFERLRLEARRALDDGDAAGAAERLGDALALWRGPPLADLAELDFVQTEIRRLEELRLSAVMDRIDAELALGKTDELVAELNSLVAASPYQERLRGQLMLALYRSGRQADALQAFRDARVLLNDELGLEPSRSLQQLEHAILVQDEALDVSPIGRGDGHDFAVCPFKGLASFDVEDARFFCGRERLVDDLVARLAEGTLVGVIGPSGIGKSSVLRAGLLRALASGALPGSDRWQISVIRPGAHPGAELQTVLGQRRTVPQERYVLAVDQFEELFTVCSDERERVEFIAGLTAIAEDPRRRGAIAIALRADFYGRCATYPTLARLLSASHVLVGPMETDEVERAIVLPAERAGLRVEPNLVTALVADVSGEPGGLPLLSTALLELWRRRDGSTLRLADYQAAGGVRGAVGRLAEATYTSLSDDGKRIARALMLRLTAGDPEHAVRRRLPATEVTQGRPEDEQVLNALVEARLLTADDGSVEVAHEALLREWPRMRNWLEEERDSRRLEAHLRAASQEWAAGGRDPGDLYRGARLAALLDWQAGHPGELAASEDEFVAASRAASDRELQAQRLRNRRLRALAGGIFALLILAMLAGGAALLQRGTARREARVGLARELGAEAVSEPRIDRALLLAREAVNLSPSPQTDGTLLATLLRTPAAIATFASPIGSRPQSLRVSPDGRTLAVSDNAATVSFYDLQTRTLRGTTRFAGYGSPVAYTADGSRLVEPAGTTSPFMEIENARTLKPIGKLDYDRFYASSASSTPPEIDGNGRLDLAEASPLEDGSDGPAFIDQWNLTTRKRVATRVPIGGRGAYVLQPIAGGRLVVVGDTSAAVINARTLKVVKRVPIPATIAGRGGGSAVSRDGRTLAVDTQSGAVWFVDLITLKARAAQATLPAAGVSAEFSPDGQTLATGAADGTVIVWDVKTGAVVQRLTGHSSIVLDGVFSPDGRTLYTCSLDGAIFAWDISRKRSFGTPFVATPASKAGTGPDESSGLNGVIPPLAVSPDGHLFAARAARTRVGIFRTNGGVKQSFDVSTGGDIGALAWSRTGGLAVSGNEGHVQLWDISGRPHLTHVLHGMGSINRLREAVTTLAFSPDGSLVAAGDVNHTPGAVIWRYGTVAVWNVATGRLLWKVRNKDGWVNDVAFSPDGTTLVAAQETNRVTVYDAHSGRALRAVHPEGLDGYVSIAFSPGGLLATGGWSGIVQLWDPSTGREIGKPTPVAPAPVASITFNPSGSTFATTGGSDGLTKLWTTATLQPVGSALVGARGTWSHAAYTPDGGRLVVVYDDGTGSVWPTSADAWARRACAVAGRNLTQAEWRQYVGGSTYRATCPGQPLVSGT